MIFLFAKDYHLIESPSWLSSESLTLQVKCTWPPFSILKLNLSLITLNQHFNATLIIQSNQLVSSLIDIYFTNLLPKFEFQLFMLWIVVFAWFCSVKNLTFEFFDSRSSLLFLWSFFDFHLCFRIIHLCSFKSTCFFMGKKDIIKGKKGLISNG